MPSLTRYHIITFDKESKKGFMINNDPNNIQSFSESDAQKIIEAFRDKANRGANANKAHLLEEALNKLIKQEPTLYDDLYKKIVFQTSQKLRGLENAVPGLFNISQGNISINREVFMQNEQQIEQIASQMFDNSKYAVDKIPSTIKRIQGLINYKSGIAYEYLTAFILRNSENIINNISQIRTKEVVDFFATNLKTSIKTNGQPNFQAIKKVAAGSKTKEEIDIIISRGEDLPYGTARIRGGFQKADITLPLVPKLDQLGLNFSLKNLGKSERISLYTGGNVTSLIEQWPGTTSYQRNLAINGLSAKDINASQFQIMKKIFLIQGLSGTGAMDIKADYLIVNTGEQERPIRVLSIYDILFHTDNTAFEILGKNISKKEVTPIEKIPRSSADFFKFVMSSTISIKTQFTLNTILKHYDATKFS